MITTLQYWWRTQRTARRMRRGIEPTVPLHAGAKLEYHGHRDAGWCILAGSLDAESVVIDVGLGEDLTFSWSLMQRYGCSVHGFDPTPRSLAYVAAHSKEGFFVHPFGIAARAGPAEFFLPANETHVSGAIVPHAHLQTSAITVQMLTLPLALERIGASRVDLLKIDIEGAEFDLLTSPGFREVSPLIGQLCVEFHHRWPAYGKDSTLRAVTTLAELGFVCAWRAPATNEEFLFVRAKKSPASCIC